MSPFHSVFKFMDIKFIIFPYPFKVCRVFKFLLLLRLVVYVFSLLFLAPNGWTFINVVSLFKEYVFSFIDSWCLFSVFSFIACCFLFFFVIFKPRPTIVKTPNLKLWITREFLLPLVFNLLFLRWKALVINFEIFLPFKKSIWMLYMFF